MKTTCIVSTGANQVEFKECEICDPADGELLVETKAVDMSRFLGYIVKPLKAAEAFQQLREQPDVCLTVVFDWQ